MHTRLAVVPTRSRMAAEEMPEVARKKRQAFDTIRREIFDRKLKPGSIISAKGLAKGLGLSRTPVREAMEALAYSGLIELRGGEGARVRTVSEEDLFEILT